MKDFFNKPIKLSYVIVLLVLGVAAWYGAKFWQGHKQLYSTAVQMQAQLQQSQYLLQFRQQQIDPQTGFPIMTGPQVMPSQPDDKTGQVTVAQWRYQDPKHPATYSYVRCAVPKAPTVPTALDDWHCTLSLPAPSSTNNTTYVVGNWVKAKP